MFVMQLVFDNRCRYFYTGGGYLVFLAVLACIWVESDLWADKLDRWA